MQVRKIILAVLIVLFTTPAAICQPEALKGVVNNLAIYKQKKDLKYLAGAKKSIDSLFITHADSLNLEKNVYRAIVYSSILYFDAPNKLNQPAALFKQTTDLVDNLNADRNIYRFPLEMDYCRRCLANIYISKAFLYVNNSDFINALQLFQDAEKYIPSFKPIHAYIAYSNVKLGNLHAAAKYYTDLINSDSTKTEYVEAASNIYKSIGDTVTALEILKKGRKLFPNDRSLLIDEANIYNNKKDYRSLSVLLPALLDNNTYNADIAFVAANCYDNLNQFDKAESLYLRAIELNSSAYDPVFDLGLLYLKQGEIKQEKVDNAPNTERALQWLKKANEISPNNINCLKALQLAYIQTGNKNQINNINNQVKQLTNQ
jgi:tetratricopeptide (TPR) repeat protein